MQVGGRLSLVTVCRGRRSLPGTGSYSPEENLHIQTTAGGHNTDHEYHLHQDTAHAQ